MASQARLHSALEAKAFAQPSAEAARAALASLVAPNIFPCTHTLLHPTGKTSLAPESTFPLRLGPLAGPPARRPGLARRRSASPAPNFTAPRAPRPAEAF